LYLTIIFAANLSLDQPNLAIPFSLVQSEIEAFFSSWAYFSASTAT
jgi:hypothetical protein